VGKSGQDLCLRVALYHISHFNSFCAQQSNKIMLLFAFKSRITLSKNK